MKKEQHPMSEKQVEEKLSQIGAQVAEITELSATAEELLKASGEMLTDVQAEVADLYESLDDEAEPPAK